LESLVTYLIFILLHNNTRSEKKASEVTHALDLPMLPVRIMNPIKNTAKDGRKDLDSRPVPNSVCFTNQTYCISFPNFKMN
jgi:hypothetical protein